MKNIIKFILLLVICNTIYSQININDIRNRIALKGPVQLPDSVQINLLIEQLLQIYGNTLDSYSDLKAGNYNIKINNGYSIEIANANKGKIVIHINKTESRLGGYSLTLDEKSVKMLVSQNNVIPFNKVTSIDNIIVRNNILIDKEILPYEELQPDERRILDKEFTTDNFVDQYNNDLELYKMCQAGLMFPYSGGHSKFVTVDDQYSSLIYFDEGLSADDNTPLNRCYGYFGDDDGEFMNPAGICVGRMTTVSNKDIYPLYIADKTGLRITSVNFVADNNFAALGKIDTTTFKRTAIITYPYDIAYFTNYLDSTDDKLWITQQHPTQNFLTCINLEGSVMQSFSGYKSYDNGQTYAFESNTLSRLAVYNDGFACLLFIDNTRNCLVSCLLGSDGLAGVEIIDSRNDYIIAHEIVPFPSSYAINSVQFQKTTLGSNVWPSLWVTSPSYIHHLKINKSGNIQYLASSNLPNNSLESFTYLRNTICYNGVYDIFTIENWSMSRGIRKYYPFCDIHSESLENYCNDCLDIMKFKATFTNDCWLYLTAKRKNRDGNWESVKIKKLNGSTIDTTFVIKWQFAGWNQSSADLFIDLQLDLPIEDYAFGDSVALSIRMYPEYSNPTSYFSSDHIENTYKGYVSKSCLPRPGGCPFIYIHNGQNDFEADNNILQRMEYSAPGVDILDVYKLRTNPKITSNSFDIYLVENEQDSAFIDKVRMFAVDFPSNKKLGVTEDNKIVIYDSVQVLASDSVMLNNSNITNDVHYHHPSSTLTTGLSTDSIYAHFSNPTDKKKRFNVSYSDTKLKETRAISIQSSKLGPNINYPVAFITNLRNLENPVIANKDTAGFLTATSIYSNIVSKMFSRRELESVVILPLFVDTDKVDHLNIKWQSNFRMKYLGIANLNYTGFTTTEVPMTKGSVITAINDSDITSLLTSDNNKYGEVNQGKLIKMTFDLSGTPSPGLTDKREYIIEVDGHYIKGTSSLLSKTITNHPTEFYISQNYPNPFNPVTKINYELPRNSKVNLVIYDILGREVVKLVNNEFKQSGRYTVDFNAQNYASGVYFYRIEAGTFVQAKKMVLIK